MKARTPRVASLSLVVAVSVVACGPTAPDEGGGDTQAVDAGGEADGRAVVDYPDAAPAERCNQMDILFVIDDSGSMAGEQMNLAANFPGFISVLDTFEGGGGEALDYRVGVTTTGVTRSWTTETLPGLPPLPDSQTGHDGALIDNGCAMPRKWIERNDPSPSDLFSCVAQVGTNGPIDEMPLEALRLAVTSRVDDGANAEFFREDALFGIVILTDEDDCSRTDDGFQIGLLDTMCSDTESVDTYLGALDTFTGERGRWATAVIAGIGPGNCSSDLGDAVEATRLLDFATKTGDNAITSSICEGDLAGALEDALATFDQACQSFPGID